MATPRIAPCVIALGLFLSVVCHTSAAFHKNMMGQDGLLVGSLGASAGKAVAEQEVHHHRLEESKKVNLTNVREQFFEQYKTHYDSTESGLFNQRYYCVGDYWKPKENGPIFLYLGGQVALKKDSARLARMMEIAKKHNALLYLLEHRYYGKSFPVPNLSRSNLAYLEVEQALADTARFLQKKSEKMATGDVPVGVDGRSDWKVLGNQVSEAFRKVDNTTEAYKKLIYTNSNKWAVFGAGYGGSLAAWFRSKYPHLVTTAYAASAPVVAKLEVPEYDEEINRRLGSKCADAVRNATAEMELQAAKTSQKISLKALFTCTTPSNLDFFYTIAEIISFGVHNPNGQFPTFKTDFCAKILDTTTAEARINVYADFVKMMLNGTGRTCDEFSVSQQVDETTGEDRVLRQILWQDCTQLGWFQTAAAADKCVRSPLVDIDWHLSVCQDLFGDEEGLQLLDPKTNYINTLYGGVNMKGSNIVFTNGANDPSSVLFMNASRPGITVIKSNMSGNAVDLMPSNYTTVDTHVYSDTSLANAAMKLVASNLATAAPKAAASNDGYKLATLVAVSVSTGIGALVVAMVLAVLYIRNQKPYEDDYGHYDTMDGESASSVAYSDGQSSHYSNPQNNQQYGNNQYGQAAYR